MIQINKSRLTLLTTTAAALLIFSASALAFFTNGGFEGGDFAGWTKLVFTNTGLTGSAPFSGSSPASSRRWGRTPGLGAG